MSSSGFGETLQCLGPLHDGFRVFIQRRSIFRESTDSEYGKRLPWDPETNLHYADELFVNKFYLKYGESNVVTEAN